MSETPKRCQHESFNCHVSVFRLTETEGGPVTGFTAEVTAQCMQCKMPFQWLGVDRGVSPLKPMMSADELTLRAPITPLEEM